MDSSRLPLVALHNATAIQQAGVPPSCAISVRVLDGIDLVMHAGDCVVIRHVSPATASIFVGLLRRPPVHRLRVRRTAIPASVVPWLLDGWRDCSTVPATLPRPVLHVLRASRTAPPYEGRSSLSAAWRCWGQRLRETGGGLVVLTDHFPEPIAATRPSIIREGPVEGRSFAGVRMLALHQGHLIPVPPKETMVAYGAEGR